MIRGEKVTVALAIDGEDGPLGNPTRTWGEPADVPNVVVVPRTANEIEPTRPHGITSGYTLHFPRGYTANLRDAKVTVRGETYRVVGDPKPYTEANVRGPWTMPVEVTRSNG